MKKAQLQTLYAKLFPFRCSEDDYEETDDPERQYISGIDGIRYALPALFWDALQVAKTDGPDAANARILDYFSRYDFAARRESSGLAMLCDYIYLEGNGSGYEYLDENNNGEYDIDPDQTDHEEDTDAMLIDIWQAARKDPTARHTEEETATLKALLSWLTGYDMPHHWWEGSLLEKAVTNRQALGWLIAWAFSMTGNYIMDTCYLESVETQPMEWDQEGIEAGIASEVEGGIIQDYVAAGKLVYAKHAELIKRNLTQIMQEGKPHDQCTWPAD